MSKHGRFTGTALVALVVFSLSAASCAGSDDAAPTPPQPPTGSQTVWEPLKIGAGGFITGIDIDPTGQTYVIRTDTYGAFVGDATSRWTQVVTASSMPSSTVQDFLAADGPWLSQGVYEIRVAPSNRSRLYMIFAATVWRSDDRGTTWASATSGYVAGAVDPNDEYRVWGQKMAVDPANADVVYAGAAGGLHVTTDGGASWSLVSGVPASTTYSGSFATYAGVTGIVFDSSAGTTAGRTNRIYAVSNGNGVYRSTDAGASWSLLSGGPATASSAAVSIDGVFYAVNYGDVLWRHQGGSWSQRSPGDWIASVTADPLDAGRVVAGRGSGHLSVSGDHGETWTGWQWSMSSASADDIAWLANANGIDSKATAAHLFDPVTPDRVWLADGIGVWRADATASPTAWISHSDGIEQLVGRDVLVPPGSSYVFTAGMDRGVFRTARDNSSYPSSYVKMDSTATLIGGWALDCSKTNPQHIVAIVNGQWGGDLSGYSLDGGATWTPFPVQPASGTSGDVIAPSIDNVIAIIGVDGNAYRSTDRGASWTRLPGVPGGLHGGYVVKKHVLAVDGGYDGATNRTLYLYAAGSGTWRSTDDGATWTQVSTFRSPGDYWHVKLRSVPGRAGHLFLATGNQGYLQPNPHQDTSLYRSADGGATWTPVAGTGEPYDVALGKAAPGQTYPAIYFAGWYENEWGIWRSSDDAATWTRIGTFPNGSLDHINTLAASEDAYGEVYVAFQGSGWAKGSLR